MTWECPHCGNWSVRCDFSSLARSQPHGRKPECVDPRCAKCGTPLVVLT